MKFVFRLVTVVLAAAGMGLAQSTPLTLEDCIEIALKNNTTLRTTKNNNSSAQKDVLASYSGILPSINASATSGRFRRGESTNQGDVPVGYDSLGRVIYERQTTTQQGFSGTSHDLGVSVDQNIFDGGEWWNAIRYAKSERDRADYYLKSVRNTVVMNVQQAFFDLFRQKKMLEVYDKAVQRSQDQLDKTQKMFELGAVAKVDLYRSQVNLGNDKIQYLSQQNAVITAKNNLNLVMGREPGEIEIVPEFSLKPAYSNVDSLYQQALEKNPELKSSEQNVRSMGLMVARSYSPLYPQLGGGFRYSRANEEFEKVYSDFDQNWSTSIGLSLRLNLFNGFQDQVRIQKSKLQHKNSMETFEYDKKNLKAAVLQSTDYYNSYLAIIKIDEENLDAAREEYRLAEERYRIGSGTHIEVRESQVNLTRAEQTLVAAKYYARITQAQLELLLGEIREMMQEKD
jgi:outer membrane protein